MCACCGRSRRRERGRRATKSYIQVGLAATAATQKLTLSAQTLGGGEMHSSESGVTDHLAISDAHALALARSCISNLGSSYAPRPLMAPSAFEEPLYPASELDGIVPASLRQPFDMRDVIARIVDGSRFHEFKKLYGTTLVCGFAKIAGQEVGIIGNNGIRESVPSFSLSLSPPCAPWC